MDREGLERALESAESAVDQGRGLQGTGFWKAVGKARNNAVLAAEYAGRIAAVDRRAFEQGVRLKVPAGVGTALLAAGTGAGVLAIVLTDEFDSRLFRSMVFVAGFGALELSTHSLAHWLVGRLMGMRFTYYFLGGPPPPRPGAKLDYATYLRVPPRKRAAMHASGAVVTKAIPFALIPSARALEVHGSVIALLLFVGVGQIVTDVLFSTKTSDWKKVKRELRAAKSWGSPA